MNERPLRRPSRIFHETFRGACATHLSRAPGRVNLIGEHTDYNGLPVFPMALRQEISMLFRQAEGDEVRVANEDPRFEARRFQLSEGIPPGPPGDWGNYLKAPCQALVRKFGPLRGIDALVTSSLPVASGLSSSSALVIAMGQALLHANGLSLPTLEMAETMARAERYTGTQGGGMDQAISLGATSGHASRIEFDPLRMFDTPVPSSWRFVVAHSMVPAEKSGGAQAAYNARTRECGEALVKIRQALGGPLSYRDLLGRFDLPELLDLASRQLSGSVLRRFRHVVAEARRVYEAEEAMRAADLAVFGHLMNASHESLRADYEVSSPELDDLVALARRGGAAGARLTGAGFGGCIVALVRADSTEEVLSALEDGYYAGRRDVGRIDELLFVAEAAGGATVSALDDDRTVTGEPSSDDR